MSSRHLLVSGRALVAATALSAVALAPTLAPAQAAPVASDRGLLAGKKLEQLDEPLVIAHRGASGYRPEHTLAAYELAVEQGADYIEPDLVSTKDGVLVARHENEISGTTDVEAHPEFADRRTTKRIDGTPVTGWFTEDFTLAELKTLRAEERIPAVRPQNTQYNGQFEVPTLAEVVELAQELSEETGREIGIAPETKHPTYFDGIGLSMEEPLVETLDSYGLDSRKDAVVLQSFEISNLVDLDRMTKLPIAQLIDTARGPYDTIAAGAPVAYADMVTARGLKRISRYADWVSPHKSYILPVDPATGAAGEPTAVVDDAHRVGLRVVTWTLRAENQFMPADFRIGTNPVAYGDMAAEATVLLQAGVDAFFTDNPDIGVEARDAFVDQ